MDLTNIEKTLEAYFEGNTTLDQERILCDYFTGSTVASHLQSYIPLFETLKEARKEVSNKTIVFPESKPLQNRWWIGIAASAGIILAVTGFMFNQNRLSPEEKEAIVAFKESRKALLFMSKHLNKGTENIAFLDEFTNSKNKVFK